MSDVLIVGAGSAGSVLAERLSADPACTVTVLEAGPGRGEDGVGALIDDATVLPIGDGSPVVRHFRATLTDDPRREADIVRGCCVGGSGAVNGGYFWADPDVLPAWPAAEVEKHTRAVQQAVQARSAADVSPGTASFAAAARSAGFGPAIVAVPLNIARGRRRGPGSVFLEPALTRSNLRVLTRTRATRLRFGAGRVVGVDTLGPGGPGRLEADRVVLSAGAIATAQLLMLSGMGPAEDLAALGIPVVTDLPVGRHCQDHPEWMMATSRPASPGHPVLDAVLVDGDLEIRPYTAGFGSASVPIGVALMRPRARGRVSLVSADPSAPPRIEHRYDSEPADVAELRRGCALVAEILSGATELGKPAWSTSQHLCGTAPMGAVVDADCRVLGVDGLSVADGSVLPRIPARGPHATIAMLAHRAAELPA